MYLLGSHRGKEVSKHRFLCSSVIRFLSANVGIVNVMHQNMPCLQDKLIFFCIYVWPPCQGSLCSDIPFEEVLQKPGDKLQVFEAVATGSALHTAQPRTHHGHPAGAIGTWMPVWPRLR
jgi:hypothetical protein